MRKLNFTMLTDSPGRTLFCLLASGWAVAVCMDVMHTGHAYPDYGDLIRWVFQFIEPLASEEEPGVLAALFSEYEFPGHGHVLTKSVVLIVSQYADFNLNIMRVLGVASYFLLIAVILYGAAQDMHRFGMEKSWWVLALMFVLLAKADEPYTIGNNLLAFEYCFILLAWLMVFFSYRYLLRKNGLPIVIACATAAALFADIAFSLALAAAFTLLFAALVSGERSPRELAPLFLLLAVVPVIIIVLGARDNATAADEAFGVVPLFQWMAAGLGSGLVSEPWLRHIGLSPREVYNTALLLGSPVLLATIITALDQLAYRRPVNLGIALIVFGMLALLGTYLTRNSLGDHYVLSVRYARYACLVPCGLVWYWMIVRWDSVNTLAANPAIRGLGIAGLSTVFVLFLFQADRFLTVTDLFANKHRETEYALEAFAFGTSRVPDRALPILPAYFEDKPELTRSTLRFYFECRRDPESCRIL